MLFDRILPVVRARPARLILALGVLALSATGCTVFNELRARDQLNKGVRAYRSAQYGLAIEHFKRAVELDPQLLNARLYLATAYANQYIPGAESEENVRVGRQAIDEFKKVLENNPDNVNSVAGIASLYFNMKKLDEAKQWYMKQIQLDPKSPEAYYSVGVVDWTQTYQPRMEAKAKAGISPEAPITDPKVREPLCEKNLPIVEESFKYLNRAIELRPDYDDAMAYLNLMYREKADCEPDTEKRNEDLKKADEWVNKSMDIKKKKAAGTPTA